MVMVQSTFPRLKMEPFHNSKMVMVLSTFPRPPKMELLLKKMTEMSSMVCLYSICVKETVLTFTGLHPSSNRF